MNDLKRGFHFEGQIRYRGTDIYAPSIDPVAVRRTIGMVFQKPNPFAMTVYRNVSYGLRLNHYKGNQEEKVEQALRRAALWDAGGGGRTGYLVEFDDTREMFEHPKQKLTQEYIQGDFS
jgi:ABC-type phosphate transport system ATPase subunit